MNTKCSILLLVIVAVIIGFSSCKNNDNVFPKVVTTLMNVVNASADTLNFYLNGTRQNNSSSLYTGSQSFYITVPAGSQNYQFRKPGTSNYLFSLPLNLKDSTNNSLYIISTSPINTFTTIDSLNKDTVPNSTQLRFVNTSSDAGSVDVFVGDTVNFKSRAFKTATVFLPTGSGQKEVKIYLAGAATPKVDTVITFQPARIYTLFSKGLINGKGNSRFNVAVVINY
jgi:hypothetical protein